MLKSGWFWLLLALAVFWSLGAYNRLVRLRSAVGQQFVSLESVLLQYQEVVQQAVTSASTSPQLWGNSYSAESDVDLWTRLQICAGLLTVAMARMQTHPLEPDSSQSLQDAAAALHQAWASLIHPDAFYVNVPEALQQRWWPCRMELKQFCQQGCWVLPDGLVVLVDASIKTLHLGLHQ